MNTVIRPLNCLEYLIAFSGRKNTLMDFFINLIRFQDDGILGMFHGDEPIGAAVLLYRDCPADYLELSYFYVDDAHRGKGYGRQFLQGICGYAKDLGKKGLTTRVAKSNRTADAGKKILNEAGFVYHDTASIIECILCEETHKTWLRMKEEKYGRMIRWLNRQGFGCQSFANSDPALIEKAYAPDSGFDMQYDPAFLKEGLRGRFLPDYSCLAEIEGNPAALTMVLEADARSLVFQLISVAKPYMNTGIVLMPVVQSIDKAFNYEYEKIWYCIFSYNTPMHKLARELFTPLMHRETEQYCYINHFTTGAE